MPNLPDIRSINWYLYPAMSGAKAYDANNNLEYEGINETSGISEDDDSWFITKYWYNASHQVVYYTVVQGAWSLRVELFSEITPIGV